MSLIKCPECQGDVSDKAVACAQCGFPLKKMWLRYMLVVLAVLLVVFLVVPIFLGLGARMADNSTHYERAAGYESSNTEPTYVKDEDQSGELMDMDVMKCLTLSAFVSESFDCKFDDSNANDGVCRLTFDIDGTDNEIVMKFIKKEGRVHLYSSMSATGTSQEKMLSIQDSFYKKLWPALLAEVDVVPVTDFEENFKELGNL